MNQGPHASGLDIRIEPWGKDDLRLLERLLGDPEMTKHLGGPESHKKILERQARYEKAGSRQFKIVEKRAGEAVGWVGYWEKIWHDEEIYELGWAVIPAFQGRGIATVATAQIIVAAKSERSHKFVHAFPSVDNGPSNAICRKLGFTLVGECDFEYPPGNWMKCNDWHLDLSSSNLGS
jgi:RimJ/RimL family protein N-acetyltransferase